MEKFDLQADDDTITQLTLLHSDIAGYDLPAIDFVSPLEEAQESHILEEEDATIYTHLEKKISSVFKICRNMAIQISYLFICSFSL